MSSSDEEERRPPPRRQSLLTDEQHRHFNSQRAINDKAEELGIRQQLTGYAEMTPEQQKAVSPQVTLLAENLHVPADTIKRYLLPPFMMYSSPEYVRQYNERDTQQQQQKVASAARHYHGYAPYAQQQEAASAAPTLSTYYAPTQVCNDFLHGRCMRESCRFLHSTRMKEILEQRDMCIDQLKIVKEELKIVKEDNIRLVKENATLVDLLPGRGGYRKRKQFMAQRSTRRKKLVK